MSAYDPTRRMPANKNSRPKRPNWAAIWFVALLGVLLLWISGCGTKTSAESCYNSAGYEVPCR